MRGAKTTLFLSFHNFCCSSSSRTSMFLLTPLPASCLLIVDKTSLASFQQNTYVLFTSVFYTAPFCIILLCSYPLPFLFLLSMQHPSTPVIQSSLCIFPVLVQILFCYHFFLVTSGIPHIFSRGLGHHKITVSFLKTLKEIIQTAVEAPPISCEKSINTLQTHLKSCTLDPYFSKSFWINGFCGKHSYLGKYYRFCRQMTAFR